MFKGLIQLCCGVAVCTLASPVAANNCGERDTVVERLETKFSEQLAMGGLQNTQRTQSVMEVWASVETGTFTVLLTDPNGISCIVAAGTDYFQAERRSPKALDQAS